MLLFNTTYQFRMLVYFPDPEIMNELWYKTAKFQRTRKLWNHNVADFSNPMIVNICFLFTLLDEDALLFLYPPLLIRRVLFAFYESQTNLITV